MKPSPETAPAAASGSASRRDFAKTSAAVVVGAAAASVAFPSVTLGVPNDKKLKVGLIGCGGRGTGAAAQALKADDNVELWAMGDIDQKKIVTQMRALAQGDRAAAAKFSADLTNRLFVGLDAFEKVMDSGVDVVLLTTPPGFRPQHFRAAVERGLHCFVEKPCASDVAGVKNFLETAKMAKDKGVSVLGGLCYRYSDNGRELYAKIHEGAIGQIQSIHATYFANTVKPMAPESDRPAGMSDIEWQVRNWYNFTWLSGDGFVEQAVHSVDKIMWAMKDELPVCAYGIGGRQRHNYEGNTYDHYGVTYEFANNIRCHVTWNQYGAGPFKENKDFIYGTEGQAELNGTQSATITGKNPWNWRKPRTPRNMYQTEHDEFFASIRKGERHADEDWVARTTLLAIMGRMATYTGKRITWEDVNNSPEKLVPDEIKWDGSHKPNPMPIPGEPDTQWA
ncbi:MAG: Gfo/Idh/MocA family oxidoreductase [Akkermansiaceae bacterium]|nr:Gfo/Idh/MocA family oxidoreductase [Verrucomicrobiae bacterium]MCP5555408.1 Gfo/Idh/MocA family oxidoreductase [Akkermansiaceae bacterium]